MPYGGEVDKPGNLAKMERCVSKVIAQGNSKESAIRICKASILGTAERKHSGKGS